MSLLQNDQPVLNARPEQTMGGAAQDMYIINSLISQIHTMMPVKVLAVSVPADTLAPIGRCEVLPLVQQIDGSNNTYSMGKIINVPYLRVQGGANAVIIDPQVGDIGLCGFCERDISIVKRTGDVAAPDNLRKYDINSAVYMFSMMSGTPTQYIHFKSNEIHIKSPNKIILDAPEVVATGKFTATGVIESLANIISKGISLLTHKHGGVQSGGSDTEVAK